MSRSDGSKRQAERTDPDSVPPDVSPRKAAESAPREIEARLRTTIDALPAALYMCDTEGRVTCFNKAAVELWGRTPEVGREMWCGSWRIYTPDGTPLPPDHCPMAVTLQEGRSVRGREVVIERPNGERCHVLVHPEPLFSESGAVIGAINLLVDLTERKRAEVALRESEERLRSALDAADLGTWRVDFRAGLITRDASLNRILGLEAGGSTQPVQECFSHVHPEDRPRVDEAWRSAWGGADVYHVESRIVRPNGEVRWIRDRGRIARGPDGQPLHATGAAADITERKQAGEVRALLAAIIAGSDDAIVSKSLDGIILSWNAGAERLFGYSAADVVGRSIAVIIPPERQEEERSILERLRRGKRVEHFETVRVCKDRRRIDVSLSVSPIRDETGRILGASKVARDISRRKAAEQALRENEARYRAVVESQAEALCRFRPDGTILFANGAYARARGTTPEALVGCNFWDFVVEEDRPAVRALLDRLTPEAPDVSIENRFETMDGERWTLWKNHALSFDANGRLIEAQASGIDITDRKRAEGKLQMVNEQLEQRVAERTAELERKTQRLRQLANQLTETEQRERLKLASTLHDGLQQILIAGKLQLPLCTGEQAAEAVDCLEKRLDEAINVSRSLSYDLSPPALHGFDLAKAIQWLTRWFHTHHHFDVTLQIDGDVPLTADHIKTFLFAAVRELLLNTVKHSGTKAATVRLRTLHPNRLSITVADDGRGFDPMELESDDEQLQGFGLFSIRERLAALGGTFQIDSRPGAGATFDLTIPVNEAEQRDGPTKSACSPGASVSRPGLDAGTSGAVRVLIVDDHAIVREGLRSLVERQDGIELVGEACDGVEAVERTDELQPDVVVMDVNMPRMNGLDATRQIKRKRPNTLIIGLSVHEEQDMAEAMCRAGASAYLRKGGDAETLLNTIRITEKSRISGEIAPEQH